MGRSEELFERAVKRIPGGVNSPVRAYGAIGMAPRFIKRADGCHIYDVDDNCYVDYIDSWGPMILGHNFPFYLNFKGGKGIAATAGLLLSFDLRLTLVAAIVFLAVFFLTHYVSLGSLLVYVVFVAGIIIMGQNGQFTGMSQANIYEMYVLAILLAILAYYKHWPNILRLIHGNENKTYLKKKKA